MTRLDIRLIAAVGKQAQIGLNGKLPWNNREDMDFFKSQVKGGVVIVGRKTYESMPKLFGVRTLVWKPQGHMNYKFGPSGTIQNLEEDYASWPVPPVVWIAGGKSVYEQWAPHIKRMVISNIDYSGEADTYFPWKAFQTNYCKLKDPVPAPPFNFDSLNEESINEHRQRVEVENVRTLLKQQIASIQQNKKSTKPCHFPDPGKSSISCCSSCGAMRDYRYDNREPCIKGYDNADA